MDFRNMLNKVSVQAWGCLFLVASVISSVVHADESYRVNIKVVNDTAMPLVLSGANWIVRPDQVSAYAISAHGTRNFGLMYASHKKGAMNFRYTAGERSCTFKAGHDTKYSFGWLKANEEAYQWANAVSDGVFKTICKARVVSNQPGKEYTVEFSIE